MSDKQFDDVLFLYNANTFIEDRMLAGYWMRINRRKHGK